MGSGMTPMMFPGIQHYMSQMGMGMATPPFPPIPNQMQLPRVPLDQSVLASQAPNQTLMCQNPILGPFNYQNQIQNPALSEQYARYMGYHLMQNASQVICFLSEGTYLISSFSLIKSCCLLDKFLIFYLLKLVCLVYWFCLAANECIQIWSPVSTT